MKTVYEISLYIYIYIFIIINNTIMYTRVTIIIYAKYVT